MQEIELKNNGFEHHGTVHVKSGGMPVGACELIFNNWKFHTACANSEAVEWMSLQEMKDRFANLTFYIQ